jgi:lipoprotein-releasing system permease protein
MIVAQEGSMSSVVYFIALRQLWARKWLNGIAVLGVSLGVTVLIAINGVLQGFQHKFLENIQRISPHITILDQSIDEDGSALARMLGQPVVATIAHDASADQAERIRRPRDIHRALGTYPSVVASASLLVGAASVFRGAQQLAVEVRGIEPRAQEAVTPIAEFVVEGSYAALAEGGGLLLGAAVARRLGTRLGEHLTVSAARGTSLRLRVVGIFDCDIPMINKSRVYMSLRDAQAVLGRPDAVGRIEVRLTDGRAAKTLTVQLERAFGYESESWQEQNANFLALFAQQNTIIGFVVAAILVVGGFGILATQIMIVLEKTRDIAILRSVGFLGGDILLGFLLQGAIVSALGALLGGLCGHGLLRALGQMRSLAEGLVKSEKFLVYEDPVFYVYGAVFALCIGLCASLVPAYRGAKIEPVDVLRGQAT